MKKIFILILCLFSFSFGIGSVKANDYCTEDTVKQLAKIIYREVGTDSTYGFDENFFMKLTTAAVVVNNANRKNGNTFYDKLYNLTDSNYQGYSSYKDNSFENVVHTRQSEMLYVAALVLSGKYALPTNMTLQATESIVRRYGTVWTMVDSIPGIYDVYFGYEGSTLSSKDIYGNNIPDNSADYYRIRSKSLMLSDYSKYNSSNVCSLVSKVEGGTSSDNNNNKNPEKDNTTIINACENPDILKVIYFADLILDIVRIVIPIGLIIIGMIDFSKSVTSSNEGIQKKSVNLFIKRIIYAILVFAVPWLVKTLIITLGDLAEGVNFTDCLENANNKTIEEIENGTFKSGDNP